MALRSRTPSSVYDNAEGNAADNLAAGNPTVRITWERLTETGAREAYRLRQIMARLRAG